MSWEKSLLVLCKTFWLFVNTLTADDKYSILNRDNFMQKNSDTSISQTKDFFQFFLYISDNFEHFQEKNTLIADVFPKLRTPQEVTT